MTADSGGTSGGNGGGREPGGCRRAGLIIAALLAVAIGIVWWQFFPRYTYHQKITLTVEAGGRDYSASSVTAVTWQYGPALLAEMKRAVSTVNGEAVHLELPGGRHLFALLKSARTDVAKWNGWPFDVDGLATYVFPEAYTQLHWPAEMKKLSETREFPAEVRPMLVTFGDPAKPETVRKVSPGNLAAVFGEGVKLKSLTLAITKEPVGPGMIRTVLPWLSDFPEPALQKLNSLDDTVLFPNTLFHGDFVRIPE